MSLKDFRESYYYFSGKASNGARNLAFAGIAIVWIFRSGDGLNSRIPDPLILPLTLFAISLGLDLLHYLLGTVTWGIFCRVKERELDPSQAGEIDAPSWLNWGTNCLFYAKIGVVIVAYCLIVNFLAHLWLVRGCNH